MHLSVELKHEQSEQYQATWLHQTVPQSSQTKWMQCTSTALNLADEKERRFIVHQNKIKISLALTVLDENCSCVTFSPRAICGQVPLCSRSSSCKHEILEFIGSINREIDQQEACLVP
jgi:hypothetical protein